MEITLFNEQADVPVTDEIREAVKAVLDRLEEHSALPLALTLLLTDDAEIRRLNAEFRGVDSPTDVLSFPAYDLGEALFSQKKDELDLIWEDGSVFIGDIAISMQRAAAQAAEYGHSLRREVAFLAVHGGLHLLGCDHGDEEDERAMKDLQERLLGTAGIGRE